MAAMMPVVPLRDAHRNGLGMSISNSGFSYAVGSTVDGRNLAPVDMENILFVIGFHRVLEVCFCSHSDFWKDFQTETNWLFPGSVSLFFWKFPKINQLTDDNGSVFHKSLGVNENRRSLHRGLRVEVWHQVPIRCGQKSGVVKSQAFGCFRIRDVEVWNCFISRLFRFVCFFKVKLDFCCRPVRLQVGNHGCQRSENPEACP